MKTLSIAGAAVLVLAAAACGESGTAVQNDPSPAGSGTVAETAGQVYSAMGHVTAVEGDQVTISHGPVEGLGWPAMTMTFRAQSPRVIEGIGVGDTVTFQFRESDGSHELVSITRR